MKFFEEISRRNLFNLSKEAVTLRLENGSLRSYSYGQMFDAAILFSTQLEQAGICPGDRIGIVSESLPEWSIAFLAIAKSRATSVLLDASLEPRDLADLIRESDLRCLFASPKVIQKLDGNFPVPVLNLLTSPDFYLQNPLPPLPLMSVPGDESALSMIYSSGTTKRASGILHSHDALLESALMCIKSNQLSSNDRFLAILPNSHIYGLVCQLIGPFLLGDPVCFLEGLNPAALVGAFQNFHPTIFPAVPKIYELLKSQILQKINSDPKTKKLFKLAFPVCLKLRHTTGLNLGKKLFQSAHTSFGGKLRILCSAGAPISADTAAFFYGLGFDMLITYGATETCIPTIGNITGRITTDSCGQPYPAVTAKISETGELLIHTPYRMLGYFRDERATAQAFDSDGWFRSGDLASIDEKGNVRILGRCKENIVLATGKKVAPDDIEAAYSGICGIQELVICGIPAENGGYDEVHAFVIAEAGQQDAVFAHLNERSATLSLSQRLRGIHFVTSIPKTSLQKPKRFLLQQMVSQEQPVIPSAQTVDIPTAVREAIIRISGVSDFSMDTPLFEKLISDSLGALDLACEIEERCGIRVEHLLRQKMTVSELIECVSSPHVGESVNDCYPKRKHKAEYNLFCIIRKLFRGIYRVKVENDHVLPEHSGYIICANHVSNFDFLYLTLNFGRERFTKFCCMAKKELFHNSWISHVLTNICGMVPIDRNGLVTDAMAAIREKLTEQWGVLIHPEGTRSQTGELGSFKNGAAVLAIEADVPIVPAYIKGGYEVFPCWKKLPQLFDWKRMRKYQIEVIYGDPILPAGFTPEELMNAIESAVKCLSKTETLAPA